MNRSVIALGGGVAAIVLAASAPLNATNGANLTAAAKPTPFWGSAPCQHDGSIFVKAFYDADRHQPNRVRAIVRHLGPNARATISLAFYQGDVGWLTELHRRADDHGRLRFEMPATSGFFRTDVDLTTSGDSCSLEIAGRLAPLP